MSDNALPSVRVAYRSLCDNGDQFATAPLVPEPLGVTFSHQRKGVIEASADPRVLATCGTIYTGNQNLAAALNRQGGTVRTQKDALNVLRRYLSRPQLVMGVSGFASRGYSCKQVGSALSVAYESLMTTPGLTPSLVCDGATGAGALGLNGVLALQHKVPSVGFAALQGLASMAPRDHMIVSGQTYRDREELVGSAPDLLMCFGGGDGSLRECLAALRIGGSVLSVLPHGSWRKAMAGPWTKEGRLVFCDTERGIPEALTLAAAGVNNASRAKRLRTLTSLLLAK